jgi:hypothetical protein
MITTEGVIQPHDTEARRALICFSSATGTDDCRIDALCRIDMAGADLSLLNSGRAPLLADHSNFVDALLGVIESAWIAGDRAFAVARFASTPRALEAWGLVRDGILANVSMGFNHAAPDDDEAMTPTRRPRHIRCWRPHEVSLVAVPGNWQAQVVSDAPAMPVHAVAHAAEVRRRNDLQAALTEARRAEWQGFANRAAPRLAERFGLDRAEAERVLADAMAEDEVAV